MRVVSDGSGTSKVEVIFNQEHFLITIPFKTFGGRELGDDDSLSVTVGADLAVDLVSRVATVTCGCNTLSPPGVIHGAEIPDPAPGTAVTIELRRGSGSALVSTMTITEPFVGQEITQETLSPENDLSLVWTSDTSTDPMFVAYKANCVEDDEIEVAPVGATSTSLSVDEIEEVELGGRDCSLQVMLSRRPMGKLDAGFGDGVIYSEHRFDAKYVQLFF